MQIVSVKIQDRRRKQNQVVNSGLLAGLPLCSFRHRCVAGLDVTAELHPELPLAMETQENTIELRRKHEAGPRDMLRPTISTQRGVPRYVQEPQIRVPQSRFRKFPEAGEQIGKRHPAILPHTATNNSLANNSQVLWSSSDIRNTINRMERKMHGREVSETEIDRWVDEAEAGYDVEELKARMGRPARGAEASQVIPVRLTVDELAAVMARAEREHLNRSEAIRAALAAWSHAA